MAYVTRYGTRVLNGRAARTAIIEEAYHRDEVAEYEVYSYAALAHGIQPGDTLMLRSSELGGYVWTVNLVHGQSQLLRWDDLAHAVKPKQRPV